MDLDNNGGCDMTSDVYGKKAIREGREDSMVLTEGEKSEYSYVCPRGCTRIIKGVDK